MAKAAPTIHDLTRECFRESTLDLPSQLPSAPPGVVDAGQVRHGRFQGRMPEVDWRGLGSLRARSRLWRKAHHKRWHYVGITSPDVFVGLAIVDVGWCMTAFAYVFDRLLGRVVFNWEQVGAPWLSGRVNDRPVTGALARYRGLGADFSITHTDGDVLRVAGRVDRLRVEAELALSEGAPILVATGPVEGGLGHSTHKTSALPVSGTLELEGCTWSLDQATACLDSSNGMLARDTAWRWACAHRPGLGFNLQQGYFGDQENALWLAGELIPLGAAQFEFDEGDPLAPWRVRTEDGLLDLRFEPQGARAAHTNVIVAASRYVQPVGLFQGTVRRSPHATPVRVQDLLGVTEDHHSRW